MNKILNKQLSKQTIKFDTPPRWVAGYSIVGPKEGNGPMADYFDYILKDDGFSEKTYEKAERKMLEHAITGAITKAGMIASDIDVLISGDLLNQIISSSFSARQLESGFLGLFGACSNMTESLLIGSALVDGGFISTAACATSSHFSTAERQFRSPLELGNSKPPSSQWTATAAGCSIVKRSDRGHKITHATIGKVVDFGIGDINNMGAAMAPAAADTLQKIFKDTKSTPQDYDLIVSGDLGKLGSELLIDLLEIEGYKLGPNYTDCGQTIFSNSQKVFMGGSGCGCSAAVYNSYIYSKLSDGSYKKVILMSTGALMSTTSVQQGETIPGIAHAVVVEADDGGG